QAILFDGHPHKIYVYGIDTAGGANSVIGGTGKTITCTAPSGPIALPPGVKKYPNQFQVLVVTNQLMPDEGTLAQRFAADGVWSIPQNSNYWAGGSSMDWNKILGDLNGGLWSVSEDNPDETDQIDFISTASGKIIDGAMMYNEDGWATPL